MTNNALKRKHLPKKSKHWKCNIVMHISDAEVAYAMNDVKSLTEFFDGLMNDIIDRYTEYMNNNRPEWWDGYGYIKEDRPII